MDEERLASLPRTRRLSRYGTLAQLRRDDLTEAGVVLHLDGVEQSHVESDDPGWLLHDYTLRIAAVLDALGMGDSVLHLGAGALTLPRWIEHRATERGMSQPQQTVLDIEPELVDFVLHALPMQNPPRSVVADAAIALAPGGHLHRHRYDVVVVDLFNSADAPESITGDTFCRDLAAAVSDEGLLVVNLGDDANLRFARRQVTRLVQQAADDDWTRCLLTAPQNVIASETEGNLVFAAGPHSLPSRALETVWAAGPHPGEVLTGAELRQWTHGPGSANHTRVEP